MPRTLTSAATIDGARVGDAELVVVAVPSRVFGDVVAELPGDSPLLSLSKGLDPATGQRLSSLVDGRPVAVLSGPNIADEIVRGLPAAAVVASGDLELAVRLQADYLYYEAGIGGSASCVPGVPDCDDTSGGSWSSGYRFSAGVVYRFASAR